MTTVTVTTTGSYDILIGAGLIAEAGRHIARITGPRKAAIVTDDIVGGLFGDTVTRSLTQEGFDVCRYAFPNGETSKTMDMLSSILEFLAGERMTKSDLVVALGGGVTGDMAGFAAAVYARGIRYVQIPTTLLAAVDSSVGGKTAVNLANGKNMAGAFLQPSLVLCDTDVIAALPDELRQNGAAEIIKHGMLADSALFDIASRGMLAQDWEGAIARNVSIKREYVMEDEFDEGKRQMLNLGHTLGHAVEKLSDYTIAHGHGVAIGMMLIARASENLGFAEEPVAEPIRRALLANGLPAAPSHPADSLLDAALLDKKRRGGFINLVVPLRVGKCELVRVPVEELHVWIENGCKEDSQ